MANVLSERIAELRKARGLTQEQLGQLAGVSAQAVSKWEKGGAPDVELLPALADRLGVTIDALFGREGGEAGDIHTDRRPLAPHHPQGTAVRSDLPPVLDLYSKYGGRGDHAGYRLSGTGRRFVGG